MVKPVKSVAHIVDEQLNNKNETLVQHFSRFNWEKNERFLF